MDVAEEDATVWLVSKWMECEMWCRCGCRVSVEVDGGCLEMQQLSCSDGLFYGMGTGVINKTDEIISLLFSNWIYNLKKLLLLIDTPSA